MAEEKAFDLIFMDVIMPGTDGFQACDKIRETSLNENTPVVFITTRNDEDARRQAEAVGGNGFIPKPVLASEILLTALTFTIRSRLDQRANQTAEANEVAVMA
jgi:CheY-like chemotaxis protein